MKCDKGFMKWIKWIEGDYIVTRNEFNFIQ